MEEGGGVEKNRVLICPSLRERQRGRESWKVCIEVREGDVKNGEGIANVRWLKPPQPSYFSVTMDMSLITAYLCLLGL